MEMGANLSSICSDTKMRNNGFGSKSQGHVIYIPDWKLSAEKKQTASGVVSAIHYTQSKMGSNPFDVVISGMSGKFPNCRNVEEFKEKLFSKEMMLIPDERRWNPVDHDKPFMTGKIPDVDKFDISFFGVTTKLARFSDPVLASTLEVSTEAMVDAGVNPYSLKGRSVAVIVASSISDAEILRYFEGTSFLDGQAMKGLARTMFANRISYAYNFTGPSYSVDSSWVSAVQGLELAVAMVSRGHAEAAVVTCVNLTFYSSLEKEYVDIDANLISQTEKCSPFDAKANGFLRSEGTVSFFIQRTQDAKRNYCTVLNSQTRCLNGVPSSFTSVNPFLETFLRDFYTESQVSPKDVSYVETFGFCNKDRDAQELNAVANVLCEKQNSPLLIGCGTGNYGIAEASSGFLSLTKAIIALEEGMIPPTINYNTPNPNVPGLINGRLKPVTEATELAGNMVAVNTLSFSGNVAHTLLRQNSKTKKPLSPGELPKDGLPRLCILQARNEEGANFIAKKVASATLDPQFVSLVNDVFKVPFPQYLWRGYTVVPGPDSNTILETKELGTVRRPVWYVFSGMGSQWAGMGRDLLLIPAFAAAIDKCDNCLRPMGVDIKHILTADDPTLFDNILNCFVGITSVQIGLVDCLRAVGVEADGMIGHSAGETCCAYADGCFTLEETILASYYRGKATLDGRGSHVPGMMAAIGIGYDAIKDKVPPTIDVACHNAADSSTVSGPVDDVVHFVEKLQRDGVYAKAVNVAGIAYHSRYIQAVGPRLRGYLNKVIKSPKPRSSKWISTSVPQSQWATEAARLCSPEYHTNNLLNPVYFEEGCKHIPTNATIVEIAPHGLLQAILRRSISTECINISLTNRTASSSLYHFLAAIGKLHLNNVEIDVNALFPPVEYPVARGTPPLSTLVTWDHEETRLVEFRAEVKTIINLNASIMEVTVSGQDPKFDLWRDHRVDGRVVLPVMQLLMYPWTLVFAAKLLKIGMHSVVLEDVIISDHVSITETDQVMEVTCSPASFSFEVSHAMQGGLSGKHIVTGKLREAKSAPFSVPELNIEPGKIEKVNCKEIYDVLSQFGIQLGPQFQVIRQIIMGENECVAKIKWTSDVIVFVDAFFKFLTYLKIEMKPLSLHTLTSFIKLAINKPLLSELPINTIVDVHYDKRCNRLVCEVAELIGANFKSTPYKSNDCLIWSELKFKPYCDNSPSVKDFLRMSLQLAEEADFGTWMKIPPPLHLLLVRHKNHEKLATHLYLEKIVYDNSQLCGNVSDVDLEKAIQLLKSPEQQRYLMVGDQTTVAALAHSVATDKLYCITIMKSQQAPGTNLKPILLCSHQEGKLALLKKIDTESPLVVPLEGKDWLEKLRKAVAGRSSSQPVVLATRTLVPRHVLPILAAESFVPPLRTVFIQQANAPQVSSTSPTFSSQLLLGLPVNVLSEGVWGSLRKVDMDMDLNNNLNSFFNRDEFGVDINYVGLNPPTFDTNYNLDLHMLRSVDYSGVTAAKQPLMGVAQFQADSKSLSLDPVLRWPVPSHFSLLDAATVPVTYGLAFYCTNLKAKVEAGETVLVHSGMSPIGQAVICMALGAGAIVITLVENEEEEKLLRNIFPSLNSSHIIIKSMEDLDVPVRKLTKGRGVDVIVNCSRGREMQSTVKLMGTDCRFLHLGHISVEDRESIGMLVFLKRTSLYGVTVDNLTRCNEEEKIQIQRGVLERIMKGDVKPLSRKTFSPHSQSDVLEFLETKNMEDKTILCLKKETSTSRSLHLNPQEFIVIAGTSSNLWLEVASWVVSNGGQHLIVLTTEKMMAVCNFHKVDRLISRHQGTLTLYPLSRFDSIEDGVELLEELLQMRPVDSVLCLNMDENSNRMRNLDLASRKAVPGLRRFVVLLGEGAGVCEARADGGFPVCCVQGDPPHDTAAGVLSHLTTLLSEKTSTARFFVVGDSKRTSLKSGMSISLTDVQEHLPQGVAELELLASNISDTQLQEAPSLSPRYEYTKHQLLPFFVIPGISSSRIEQLTQQLMHPVFCPTLPPSLPTVKQCAAYLLEQIEKIQEKGPYNLIAETWSGVVTLHLASLLEAQGHEVVVFLLDAAPSLSQAWARVFLRPSGLFASQKFLTCILGSQDNVPKGLNDLSSWDEQLDLALNHLVSTRQTTRESSDCIRKYVSSLKTRLMDIMDYKPQQLKVKATVHLIRTRTSLDSELFEMSKYCQQRPLLHIMEDGTLKEVIKNPKTAAIINENAIFTWKL